MCAAMGPGSAPLRGLAGERLRPLRHLLPRPHPLPFPALAQGAVGRGARAHSVGDRHVVHPRLQPADEIFLDAAAVPLITDRTEHVAFGGAVIPIGAAPLLMAKQARAQIVRLADIKRLQEEAPATADKHVNPAIALGRQTALGQHAFELVAPAALAPPGMTVEQEHERDSGASNAGEARLGMVNAALSLSGDLKVIPRRAMEAPC